MAGSGVNYNFVDPGEISQAMALAVSALGAVLALQYNVVATEAMDKAEDISDRIFAIEKEITDHWINNQYPQSVAVVGELYGYVPPSPAYGTATDTAVEYGEELETNVRAGADITQERYKFCVDDSCNRETDIASAAAQVDFAQQLMRHQERRQERETQDHAEFALKAYRASREAPDDMFVLLRNAQNVYGNIYNLATQGVDGAMSMVAKGLGTFIGGFFNT